MWPDIVVSYVNWQEYNYYVPIIRDWMGSNMTLHMGPASSTTPPGLYKDKNLQ